MSSIDLIILGFLRKKPMSAYELVKMLETIQFKKWVKIGSPTIYQNIKKLAAKNLLSTRTVKEGEMPDKTEYRLNAAGEAHFSKLMHRFSDRPGDIFFDFSAFIVHLGSVEKEEGIDMLNDLQAHFIRSRADVLRDKAAFENAPMEGRALISLYESLFNTLIRWAEGVAAEYRQEG